MSVLQIQIPKEVDLQSLWKEQRAQMALSCICFIHQGVPVYYTISRLHDNNCIGDDRDVTVYEDPELNKSWLAIVIWSAIQILKTATSGWLKSKINNNMDGTYYLGQVYNHTVWEW